MNKRRRLIFAVRTILGLFLIYWAFQFISGFYSILNNFKAEITSKAFKVPAIDYSYDYFFKKEKLTSSLTYYIQGKEPLSTYTYNKNICIVILEMQGTYAKPINDVVSIGSKSTDRPKNLTYNTTFKTKLIDIARIGAIHHKATNLNLNLYGDSISLRENTEQMIYYRLKLGLIKQIYIQDPTPPNWLAE